MKKGTLTERQVIDIFEIIKQKASDKMQSGHLRSEEHTSELQSR